MTNFIHLGSVCGIFAWLAYVLATVIVFRSLRSGYVSPTAHIASVSRIKILSFAWLAAILHALSSFYSMSSGPNFSFLSALSMVSWMVVVVVLITALFKPIDKLGLIVFPLSAIALLLALVIPEETRTVHDVPWPMTLHIVSSITAYAFLNIAAVQAGLLAWLDIRLRTRHIKGLLVSALPPLQAMETMLFQLISVGLGLLTISLITGFLFLENMFAQHLAHKTVLSLLAWGVFTILLIGRARYGWRGQTAIRWTLGGFFSLMLAYFGSKMVLEWILGRI